MEIIGFGLVIASIVFGFTTARKFVRDRLRYVDAVKRMRAPVLAGVGAGVIALLPFAVIPLPFFGLGAAALFGFSVGAGVRAGVRDLGGTAGYIEGP